MQVENILMRDYKILHLKTQVYFQTYPVVQLNPNSKEIINATFLTGYHTFNKSIKMRFLWSRWDTAK